MTYRNDADREDFIERLGISWELAFFSLKAMELIGFKICVHLRKSAS
ncbi:hypothetical protein D1AOALGA4SA_8313 [Olavius algarvensis Delta 1 endosymbiont]|nr:hypothetical protein D1AOALGA4SA_8313 [Olavius algarvensis Delta 1 endosymbiont]